MDMGKTMTDFRATDSSGADLAIAWTADGGARIRVGGTQPMDQPPCSMMAGTGVPVFGCTVFRPGDASGWMPLPAPPRTPERGG